MQRFAILTAVTGLIALSLWYAQPAGLAAILQAQSDGTADSAEAPESDPPAEPDVAPEETTTEDSEPDPVVAEKSDRAAEVVEQARQRLLSHTAVRAALKETISIGTRTFDAEGSYLAGAFPKMRLEFKVSVGASSGTLTEICDGQLLWTVRTIDTGISPQSSSAGETVVVTRRDVEQIVVAAAQNQGKPESMLMAHLGFGGLPALLAGLQRAMIFDAIREEDYATGRYLIVQGHWKDEYAKQWQPEGAEEDALSPPFVPDLVRVYFDADTLFPTRVLYLKRTSPEKRTYQALVSLEFTDVVLNGDPIPNSRFEYEAPAQVQEQDITKDYVNAIRGTPGDGASPAPTLSPQ